MSAALAAPGGRPRGAPPPTPPVARLFRDGAFRRWRVPQPRVHSLHDWGRVVIAVYDRGDGEGVWQSDQHRLVCPLAHRPALTVEVTGERARDLPPGEDPIGLAFYPAGMRVRTAGPGSRYAHVSWDPSLYAAIAPHLPSTSPSLRHEIARDELIGSLVRTLANEIGAGTADRLLAESLVSAIAMRIVQRQGALAAADARAPDLASNRLRRVLDHIEANLGAELGLAELADVACLHPCHLSKSFKAAVGVGPQRYVARRRVERAKELLARTALPLVAIAQDLGFGDQSHFTNVFRREVGTTPARFRAETSGASAAGA